MATELGLLSLTHLHKLAHSQDDQNNQIQDQNQLQLNPNTSTTTSTTAAAAKASWMWNPKAHQRPAEDDDSWEVRAFAEDTGNVMGTTWPPRSYTCAFCRREFRSAQALGGHMNVHRRDRARLHQVMPPNSIINHPASSAPAASNHSSTAASSSSFLIPTGEFIPGGGGLCLVYQLPNPNGAYACSESLSPSPSPSPSPSTLLSVSPYPHRNLARPAFSRSVNFLGGDNHVNYPLGSRQDQYHPNRPAYEEPSESTDINGGDEELDLELRLGHGPTPS